MSADGKKILRVFPRRTAATPTDAMIFVGEPPLPGLRPHADEVHVSVTFSWDLPAGRRLQRSWQRYYRRVLLGGPATGDPGGQFVPGRYLRTGYTITSRGCPNGCRNCLVPGREGPLRELRIRDGWDVQDNNLLACSRAHVEAVLEMLRRQPQPARFSGGLEARRVSAWFVEAIRHARIGVIYMAFDRPADWPALVEAVGRMREAFRWPDGTSRRKLACYVLVAQGPNDTPMAAAERCAAVAELGVSPFPMYYRPPVETWQGMPPEWHDMIGRTLRQPWAAGLLSRPMIADLPLCHGELADWRRAVMEIQP